jgi:choline dehydrogenase-like flavoprotein
VPVLDYDESRLPASLEEHSRLTRRFQSQLLRAGMLAPAQRIGLNGTAHACGTLVCGQSDADSVVSRGGRVHGMHGLFVVDGSVLPRSSSVNPSLSIFAWALSVAAGIGVEFANSQELLRAGARS